MADDTEWPDEAHAAYDRDTVHRWWRAMLQADRVFKRFRGGFQGKQSPVQPPAASYNAAAREFILPYEAVRTAPDPDATLLQFLQSTYEAAATRGHWDRETLERSP